MKKREQSVERPAQLYSINEANSSLEKDDLEQAASDEKLKQAKKRKRRVSKKQM